MNKDKTEYPLHSLYTVDGFRKQMREALNKAEAGQPVLIQRYDKLFTVSLQASVKAVK